MILNQRDTTSANPNLGTMLQFNNLIQDLNLFDIPLLGRTFTWSNGRPRLTFSKLDWVLISNHWNALGASFKLSDAPQTVSDHAPIMLHMQPHIAPVKRTFKFETYWLKHSDIRAVIQEAWSATIRSPNPKRLHQKVRLTQRKLTVWAAEVYGKKDTYLRRSKWVVQQLDHAQEVRQLTQGEFLLRIVIRAHIFNLSSIVEEKWRQRSGARWLKLGDNNTKYFHAVANGRKNANNITLFDEQSGEPISSNNLEQVIFDHFNSVLGTTQADRVPFDLTGKVGPQRSAELKSLDEDITEVEIKRVVHSLPRGKASGPDGMPT